MRPARFLHALVGLLSTVPTAALGASNPASESDHSVSVGDVMRESLAAYANSKRSSLGDQIANGIVHLASCAACESLLVILKVLAALGDKAFVGVITEVCQSLKVEDKDVCTGAIGLEGPILAHDLREMKVGSRTSTLFCLTIFGLCQWPDVDKSYMPPFSSPKPAMKRPPQSGKPPLKVVHISDIHVDHSYETGANYNCTKPICCRPYTPADAPGNTDYPAGPYGHPQCDSPVSLEDSMYSAIASLVPDRAFTIFTGDVVEAAVWMTTNTEVTNDLHDAFARMQSTLGTVYAATGNHESSPVNSFPPGGLKTDMSSQWVYDELSRDWNGWIGASAAGQVSSNFGSYSYVDGSGLRIISVNTNFWYKQNFWLFEKTMERDPSGMFAWLVRELETAEAAGQRAWVIGHMPLGVDDAFHDASYYFDLIIQRFDATIAALFFGHTHQDEFQIAYSDYSNQAASTAVMTSYIAPAMTPRSGNPAFRVYDIDPVTFAVLDFTIYTTTDLPPSTADPATSPTWHKLYSAKEAYGRPLGVTSPAAELTPAFWHDVTALFQANDTLFGEYYARKSRGFDDDVAACDADCKKGEICQLRAAQARFNCKVVKPGVNFSRRSEEHGGHGHGGDRDRGRGRGHGHGGKKGHGRKTAVHECEGSQAAPILAAIPGVEGVNALREAMVGVLGEDVLEMEIPREYYASG